MNPDRPASLTDRARPIAKLIVVEKLGALRYICENLVAIVKLMVAAEVRAESFPGRQALGGNLFFAQCRPTLDGIVHLSSRPKDLEVTTEWLGNLCPNWDPRYLLRLSVLVFVVSTGIETCVRSAKVKLLVEAAIRRLMEAGNSDRREGGAAGNDVCDHEGLSELVIDLLIAEEALALLEREHDEKEIECLRDSVAFAQEALESCVPGGVYDESRKRWVRIGVEIESLLGSEAPDLWQIWSRLGH